MKKFFSRFIRVFVTLALVMSFTTTMTVTFPVSAWAVDVADVPPGASETYTAGSALTTGNVVYLKAADGKVYGADTDVGIYPIGIVDAGSGGTVASGALVSVASKGSIIGESGLTVNGAVYWNATAADYDQTGVAGFKAHPLGYAKSATEIIFDINPSSINLAPDDNEYVFCFEQNNVASSQTATALTTTAGGTVTGYTLPKAGSVRWISAYSNASITSNSVTHDVTIDGTATGLQAILNVTNTVSNYSTQNKNLDTFTAGQILGVDYTTGLQYAPVTADQTVCVGVEF